MRRELRYEFRLSSMCWEKSFDGDQLLAEAVCLFITPKAGLLPDLPARTDLAQPLYPSDPAPAERAEGDGPD
jgi:hypothetical protein